MTEEAQNKDGRRWFKGSLNYWKISQRKRDEFSLSGLSLFSSAEDVSDLELIKISHTTAPNAHVVGGKGRGEKVWRRSAGWMHQSSAGVRNGAITEPVVYPNNIHHHKRRRAPLLTVAPVKFHMWANAMVCVNDVKQLSDGRVTHCLWGESVCPILLWNTLAIFGEEVEIYVLIYLNFMLFSVNIAFYHLFHYDLYVCNKHLNTWKQRSRKLNIWMCSTETGCVPTKPQQYRGGN